MLRGSMLQCFATSYNPVVWCQRSTPQTSSKQHYGAIAGRPRSSCACFLCGYTATGTEAAQNPQELVSWAGMALMPKQLT